MPPRRPTSTTRGWLANLGVSCAAAAVLACGCLDAGPTPLGRHLVASRLPETVEFAPGPVGGPNRIFSTRAQNLSGFSGLTIVELSTVDDPGPGSGPTPARLLAEHIGRLQQSCPPCQPPVDSLGRIYVDQVSLGPSTDDPSRVEQKDELIRIDPATGEERDLGAVSSYETQFDVSSDRTRVSFLPLTPSSSSTTVLDVNGGETVAPFRSSFVDEDLFLLSEDGDLAHLPRGSAAPETVAAKVESFLPLPRTSRGRQLELERFGQGLDSPITASLLDVPTLTEISLPPTTALSQTFVPSPSGRFFATALVGDMNGGVTLTLFDRDTGHETVFNPPAPFAPTFAWRPAHDEVWFDDGPDLYRWPVAGAPERAGSPPGMLYYPRLTQSSDQELPLDVEPAFTPDGQFRLVATALDQVKPRFALQPADDATAAPVELNPTGTGMAGLWPLAGGQLLVEDWITELWRTDMVLVDPVAGTSRALATSGNVVATGRDRFLALLNWRIASNSGDLTLVDYATGEQTLVAQNVHSAAVDTSTAADDGLAPGTRVAFLVRNRIASPYDGIWVLDLP